MSTLKSLPTPTKKSSDREDKAALGANNTTAKKVRSWRRDNYCLQFSLLCVHGASCVQVPALRTWATELRAKSFDLVIHTQMRCKRRGQAPMPTKSWQPPRFSFEGLSKVPIGSKQESTENKKIINDYTDLPGLTSLTEAPVHAVRCSASSLQSRST